LFFDRPESGQRAVLVHIAFSGTDETIEAAEFVELARSAALHTCTLITGRRREPHPRTFVAAGKLDEIRAAIDADGADLVLFDHDLSAAQQRNIEAVLERRVMGRTELILHIFADRARTHEGQLQVELAQLDHARSRLVRGWVHLDRQKGGVNLRGAGETQLELDQRMLNDRMRAIEKKLTSVRRQRDQGRRQRRRASVPTVALVGYTNAGKSTLFNCLTESQVLAQDRLFATLDPTLRRLGVDGIGDVVLADTVGFIRDLPHGLVEAFKATLEEVSEADLLLHVIDAAATDLDMQRAQVLAVLEEIGAGDRPVLEVHNKIDLLGDAPRMDRDEHGAPVRVALSARTGLGLELLGDALAERFGVAHAPQRVRIAPAAGRARSWLYGIGAVLSEQSCEDGDVELIVRMSEQRFAQLLREPGVLLQGHPGVPRIAPASRAEAYVNGME
jgi:GTPase